MDTEEVIAPFFTVKTLTDRAIKVELTPIVKIMGDVKAFLERKEQIAHSKITLIKNGVVLSDSEPAPEQNDTIYWFYYEKAALAADPIDTASDWDTKNRMKIFKGLYLLSTRKFDAAAELLVGCLASFTDVGLISFKEAVKYATIAAIVAFERPSIQKSITKSPEVLEVIHEMPELQKLVGSFYNCRYGEFFTALANVELELKNDWLLAVHVSFIVKELRIRAYKQILSSYRSLSLASMANAFGVTTEFVDLELSRFIAADRLNCIIDKVSSVVITNPPDQRNAEYVDLMKQSDALLAKMQKLGRILNY